jgi:tetratricopeptide (TPR) repeat protein
MKRNLLLWVIATLACGSLTYLAAQQGILKNANRFEKAIALYHGGNAQQAKDVISGISEQDPDYGAARCYNALCLYELKDYVGFYREMELPVVKKTVVPQAIREDLAFKHIDVLFYLRRFEDIFPRIQAFQNEFPGSAHLNPVTEYRMAALFERGMKKAIETSNLKDPEQSKKRWAEATANLQEFLTLVESFTGATYTIHPKRVLKEDVWSARIVLGDETAALEEIPLNDAAGREKLSLLRIYVYQKLQPDQVDKNLQMMSEFLQLFPATRSRPRVEFDMADIAFHQGERLAKEADEVERAGDTPAAQEKRLAARRYFEMGRPLQSAVKEDKASGIEASDIRELQEGLLCSYYWEQDYDNLTTRTTSLLASSAPGDENWLRAKVFNGAALVRRAAPQLDEAAATFDEVLAFGFKNKSSHDRFIAMSARWRFYIALRIGDEKKARELVQWMQAADCTKNIKAAFLKDHQQFGVR